jgi:hypothetical protein
MEEEYKKGYKQGQIDLIEKWNRWRFGNWFFKRQKKEIDRFIEEMKDIKPAESKKDFSFPDYKNIIPIEVPDNFVDFGLTLRMVDAGYFYEHVKMIEKATGRISNKLTHELKQTKKMDMLYSRFWAEDGRSEFTILTMPLLK